MDFDASVVRLIAFSGALVIFSGWEYLAPRIDRNFSRKTRWFNNYILALLDIGILRVIFPILPVGVALFADQKGWGLINMLNIPEVFAVIIGVIVLDFVIYLQHVMFHSIPNLWRIHMMHHTDLDLDLSSGLRFHPIEHILSMIIKISAVVLIGAPALAVLIFEIALNAVSMFNHSNIYLPVWLDRIIRAVIVTPDMHRTHHSVKIRETNSNFGFNLSWWDRLLGTYKEKPDSGHENIKIGHALHREEEVLSLKNMLLIPFKGKIGNYPINH